MPQSWKSASVPIYTELKRGQETDDGGDVVLDENFRPAYSAERGGLCTRGTCGTVDAARRGFWNRKGMPDMTNFEKFTATPEILGELLASLTVIDSPREDAFHKAFSPTWDS